MNSERIIIIGAGQAGAQAAITLRQVGYDGEILMIGAEPAPPYHRPPLSKSYLKGDLALERLHIRPPSAYEKLNIVMRLGEAVSKIDRRRKCVMTETGARFDYDKLLLATGAPPRRLAAVGADLKGVCYLRTLADSDLLRTNLGARGRVVIVGAGYIGLETAAVARQLHQPVTILERADRVLARVASKPVSDFFHRLHCAAGAEIALSSNVQAFSGDGALTGVELSDGQRLDCAAALIGVGAAPDMKLAEEAGLEVGDGVIVNEGACTSDEHIWAAGDCANFPSPRYKRRLRLESVPNAIEQAKVAAQNMLGRNIAHDAIPWFWSDQHDVKLQTVGLGDDADQTVVRGDPDSKCFSVWRLNDGKPLAVDTINDPVSFAMGKRVIAADASVDPSMLADASIDLRTIISSG